MQEKNRHIILDAINSLPVHKAPAMAWDNIETMMLAVPTDVFPVYEAPAAIWASVQKGISGQNFFRSTAGKIILMSLFAVLISGAGIMYFSGNRTVVDKPGSGKMDVLPLVEEEKMKDEGGRMKEEGGRMKDEALRLRSGLEDDGETEVVMLDEVKEVKNEIVEVPLSSSEDLPITTISKVSLIKLNPPTLKLVGGLDEQKDKLNLLASDLDSDDLMLNGSPNQDCNFYDPIYDFRIGLNMEYMPFLNDAEPDNAKMKYWFSTGLGAIFKRDRLSIETGLGLSFSKDKIDYSYNYLTHELVSSYEYVDSVHVDPITGQVQYFTTTVDIYDSVSYSKQTSLEKKYTYLQIPLLIGYDVAKYRNFIFMVKAGFTYFSEIKMKESNPELFHENSRITNYQASDVSRKKDFLKMSAGISARWHFNKNFNLTVSPTFHYFFTNIYEGKSDKKPISVGFRIGVYYKL